MADNTVLSPGVGGDVIRTLDKTGTGSPKTEVVALDLGGGDGRGENIINFPVPASLPDIPDDGDGNPVVSLSSSTLESLETLFNQLILAGGYPITPAELAVASGAPVINTGFTYGNVQRYGVVPNNPGMAGTNTAILRALWNPAIANGPAGQFFFPNTAVSGSDTYYINGQIPIRDGVRIDLQQSTINASGTGAGIPAGGLTSPDTGAGFFFAIRDFELKNGYINVTWNTGPSTSSGNAITLGGRSGDAPLWPISLFDSVLNNNAGVLTPMGNINIEGVRITMNVTGPNASGTAAISMTGGLQGVQLKDVYINGSGTLTFGVFYEFGWATSTANNIPLPVSDVSMRQTSHARNWVITNLNITNMGNTGGAETGLTMDVAYNVFIDGYYFSGVSNGMSVQPGESGFVYPWVGVDDVGSKHNITIRNVVGQNFTNVGLSLWGTWTAAPGTGYHTKNWATSTQFILNQTVMPQPPAWAQNTGYTSGTSRVTANGNLYNCVQTGTSSATGTGPSAKSAAIFGGSITDGTAKWDYYPWQLWHVTSVSGTGTSAASGLGPFLAYGTSAPYTYTDNAGANQLIWTYNTSQAFTDLGDVSLDGFALNGGTSSWGIWATAGKFYCMNGDIQGCQNGIVLTDECVSFDIDTVRITGMQQNGITDQGNAIWFPPRYKRGVIKNCIIRGCSASSAGTYVGINLINADGVFIDNCRFGYEIFYDYVDEKFQAQGVSLPSSTTPCTNIKVRSCRFGGAVGGIALYNNSGTNANGNTYENCSFNTAGSGLALLPLTNPISSTATTAATGAWVATLAGPSVDRGDGNVTLQVGIDNPVQQFKTTLTANRTITLSTTGATIGSTFRIIRTAGGAFTLAVGSLMTIPNGETDFVDVIYDGSAWQLAAFSQLPNRTFLPQTGGGPWLTIGDTTNAKVNEQVGALSNAVGVKFVTNAAELYPTTGTTQLHLGTFGLGAFGVWTNQIQRIAITSTGNTTIGPASSGGASAILAAGTTTVQPLQFTSGTNLTSAVAGSSEYDGTSFYFTNETSSGRGLVPVEQYFHLAADGGGITTIANFFGTTSNISLVSGAYYEIEIVAFFVMGGTGSVVTWSLINSAAPTSMDTYFEMSPVTGVVAPPGTATLLSGQIVAGASATTTVATTSLTASSSQYARFRISLKNGTGTSLQIQIAETTTTTALTPKIGSFWKAKRIPSGNVGTFAA